MKSSTVQEGLDCVLCVLLDIEYIWMAYLSVRHMLEVKSRPYFLRQYGQYCLRQYAKITQSNGFVSSCTRSSLTYWLMMRTGMLKGDTRTGFGLMGAI